jgi:hypothetical protein
VPAAIKALSTGTTDNLGQVIEHAGWAARGARQIKKGVDGLFTSEPYAAQQGINAAATERNREKLRAFIEKGGVNQQIQNQAPSPQPSLPLPGYAAGGMVQSTPQMVSDKTDPAAPILANTDAMSKALPEQASMMQAARSRVSNYLSSLSPNSNPPKLPFDAAPQNKEQDRKYNRALDLANEPMSVLNHVKNGTLTPETLKHFVSMYPELHNHLSKEITKRISQAQLDDEKPVYKTRLAMGLFTGVNMDSTMTPQAIISAQPVPQQPQPPTATTPGNRPKRSTSSLNKLPNQYKTPTQAADSDRSGRD